MPLAYVLTVFATGGLFSGTSRTHRKNLGVAAHRSECPVHVGRPRRDIQFCSHHKVQQLGTPPPLRESPLSTDRAEFTAASICACAESAEYVGETNLVIDYTVLPADTVLSGRSPFSPEPQWLEPKVLSSIRYANPKGVPSHDYRISCAYPVRPCAGRGLQISRATVLSRVPASGRRLAPSYGRFL
jgi:hypothetical protein